MMSKVLGVNSRPVILGLVLGASAALPSAWALDRFQVSSDANASYIDTNRSYLEQRAIPARENFLSSLFDRNSTNRYRQEYEDMNRQFEYRRAYSQYTANDAYTQRDRNAAFLSRIMGDLQRDQVSRTTSRITRQIRQDDDLQFAQAPLAAIVFAAGVYTGREYKYRLSEDTTFRFRSDIRRHGGANFTFNSKAAGDATLSAGDGDRYGISFSRGLIWDVSSSVSYKGRDQLVATRISRPIVQNLNATWGSDISASNARAPEQLFQLNYGLNF